MHNAKSFLSACFTAQYSHLLVITSSGNMMYLWTNLSEERIQLSCKFSLFAGCYFTWYLNNQPVAIEIHSVYVILLPQPLVEIGSPLQ